MTLRARLLLLGAVLPALGLLVTVLWATYSFREQLERELDQRLLAQAAVEANSLFDGPRGEPHLHLPTSPLLDAVTPFLPHTALYGPDAKALVRFPKTTELPLSWAESASKVPVITTTEDGRFRRLSVEVTRKASLNYVLVIQSDLAPIRATVRDFAERTGLGAALILSSCMALILWQAQRLASRVTGLTSALGADSELNDFANVGDEIEQVKHAITTVREREKTTSEARERLLANAAHQLKTPLAVLQTELNLATRKTRTAEEMRQALDGAQNEVRRLGAMANALLDYEAVHLQTLRLENLDMGPLVAELADRFSQVAEARSVQLDVDCAPGAWVRGSALWLEQALSNIIDNALRYAPRGSSVGIKVSKQADRVVTTVNDRGPGIPEAAIQRVLEPFGQCDSKGGGVGLGLAIANEVARKHNGTLSLSSRPASGTTVSLELPSAGAHADAVSHSGV